MKKTQKDKVLNHLQLHNTLTSMEAFDFFKITRLSSIINILRKEGYDIESRKPKKGNYSIYHLWGTKHQTHHITNREKKEKKKGEQAGFGFKVKSKYDGWPD